MTQALMPPVLSGSGGRPTPCEKPRQFQPHWWDFLRALPTQVQRPLRDALNARLSLPRRRAGLYHARRELESYRRNMATYAESIDAMMHKRGMEQVDPADAAQADAFVERLGDSGLKALNKRQRVGAAIAYADMTLEWLDQELADGN